MTGELVHIEIAEDPGTLTTFNALDWNLDCHSVGVSMKLKPEPMAMTLELGAEKVSVKPQNLLSFLKYL